MTKKFKGVDSIVREVSSKIAIDSQTSFSGDWCMNSGILYFIPLKKMYFFYPLDYKYQSNLKIRTTT